MAGSLRLLVRAVVGELDDDKLPEREKLHRLQEWAGIVTATLERLPPDPTVVECLALMGISFNDQWRAQAIAALDRNPKSFDRLCETYPDWVTVVNKLVEAHDVRPLKRGG